MNSLLRSFALSVLLTTSLPAQSALTPPPRTFGTVGKELTPLGIDKEAELFNYHGKGCLTHMWFGGDFKNCAHARVRVYVDGEAEASIDMELFLGTGIGFGDQAAPWGSEKMGRTGKGDTVYNTFHIPFGRSVRVTGQLAPDSAPKPSFWWIIRGTENLPVRLGGVTLPDTARLKLYKLENHLAQPLEEFAICDVPGAGALYLTTVQAAGTEHLSNDWRDLSFMEGCVRAYLNGGKDLLLLSSGFEDYFLGTYYFNAGRYANALAGVTHLDAKALEVSAYRFHDDDPVFFEKGLKLTLRCGDTVNGRTVAVRPPRPTRLTCGCTGGDTPRAGSPPVQRTLQPKMGLHRAATATGLELLHKTKVNFCDKRFEISQEFSLASEAWLSKT